MSERKIRKWVERHGTDPLPEDLNQKVSDLGSERRILEQARMLDHLIAQQNVPDPGEAYWANFAPRVARSLQVESKPIGRKRGAGLAIRWASLGAVAVLTVLIGREMLVEVAQPPVVQTQLNDRQSIAPSPPADTKPDPGITASDTQADQFVSESISDETGIPENQSPSVQEKVKTEPVPSSQSDYATEPLHDGIRPDALQEEPTAVDIPRMDLATQIGPESESAGDNEVWPERQITRMGEIASDTPHRLATDERSLRDEDRQVALGYGTESDQLAAGSSDAAMPGRLLEGPQIRARSGFADTQSPADEMLRINEMQELRSLIGGLQSGPVENLPEANRADLCAYWYRLGLITDDQILIDSAIHVIGSYQRELTGDEAQKWQGKIEDLVQRQANDER